MKAEGTYNYGWTTAGQPHSCDYIAPEVLKVLESISADRVVDIGSGNGVLCSILHLNGYSVVGVEQDHQGVEVAKQSFPDVNFYPGSIEDNPDTILPSEKEFDCAVSTEVIEHLFSPHLLPVFASRVLREEGFLLITTPYHGYLKNLMLSVFNKWDDHHTALWHGGLIKFWSRKTLTRLLEENGFNVIRFSGVGRLPYLWKSMGVLAQKTL